MAPPARTASLRPTGRIDASLGRTLYDQLNRLARRRDIARVEVDLSQVPAIDSAGVVVLSIAQRTLETAGKAFERTGVRPEHQAAFELLPPAPPVDQDERDDRPGVAERTGDATLRAVGAAREVAALLGATLLDAGRCLVRRASMPRGAVVEQAVAIGVDAVPIVGLLSWLLGLILAFQASAQLRQFGAQLYVADVVGIAMVREFGPLLTAILLAGRSGSAIAAELGTMSVNEELDALRTMGIRVSRFLVLPRMVAITVIAPALALMAIAFGVVGGALLAEHSGLSASVFWHRVTEVVLMEDFAVGMSKAMLFAWIVGLSGVVAGLRTRGAAHNVGRSATRAVVVSIFLIIVADSIITTLTTRTAL